MRNVGFVILYKSTLNVFNQKQGNCGKVTWEEGNQMPGPGKKNTAKGVAREIHVYEVTTLKETVQENGLFKEIKTPFVGKTVSEADGSFKLKLPPGKYSVFTKETD